MMRTLRAATRRAPRPVVTSGLVTLFGLLLGVSGCTLNQQKQVTSSITLTEPTVSSAFVAVVPGPTTGPSLAPIVAATARPGENGKPAAPGAGATSFQQAEYRRSLARWQAEVTRARQAVAARTDTALAAWASALDIVGKVSHLPRPAHLSGSLAGECDVAASALAGLSQAAGASFGGRRVVLLYAPNLDGTPPPGELSGDDVIVDTPFLPSAAAVSTAQSSLLAAGATRATILGPEATPAQLSRIVTLGLSQKVITETLSGAALFANDSARLAPSAVRVLTPLIAPLREAGAAAVINGYASTPGSRETNYLLSYARAEAVAAFLEARGIPASSLDIIGHGATGLVASGPSAANRRVVVVIEEPAAP